MSESLPISLEAIVTPSALITTPSGSDTVDPSTPSNDDPLLLGSRLQTEEHINNLRHRKKARKQGKVVGEFYEKQNKEIEALLMTMDKHIENAQEEEDTNRLAGSLIANCVLAILQIYAAASSLSLSFFATAMDAVFDPMANILLNYCRRKAASADPQRYLSGGSRLETIGDIVYAGAMGSVSVVLIAFSIQNLVSGSSGHEALHIPSVVVVGIAFLTKLALFIYCYSVRTKNSQVRVLWEDHRNDLAVNAFVALIVVWGRTLYGQFLLAGVAAPVEFQKLVIYKAMTFEDGIKQIDSCAVYHAGPDYVVELDIVMEAETPLWKAHDLAQALQNKIEQMPKVGRAFVHVDHETSHKPEHRKTK
ncbi:CDF manganese transporter [Mycena vulgaris]|nr:CDF manganese transporter [Mycena vulgaris]